MIPALYPLPFLFYFLKTLCRQENWYLIWENQILGCFTIALIEVVQQKTFILTEKLRKYKRLGGFSKLG